MKKILCNVSNNNNNSNGTISTKGILYVHECQSIWGIGKKRAHTLNAFKLAVGEEKYRIVYSLKLLSLHTQ